MAFKYKPPGTKLKFIGVASTFLNRTLYDALGNKTKGCSFPRFENQRLKARLEDEMIEIIAETLQGNEMRPDQWRDRLRLFRSVTARLKHFLVLTDMAYYRHYISEDEAGKWQETIDDLTGKMGGLINAALPRSEGKP